MYRDDIFKRDMDWIRKINPNTRTIEMWMRENNYTGDSTAILLKNAENRERYKGLRVNREKVLALIK